MILLYSKKCLYRNRIVCGIFMAAVLIAAYLNGISHTTPITTDSYIESYNKTQVEAEAVVISRTDKETYIQLILDRAKLVLKENKDISADDIILIANISDVTIKPGDKVHIEGEATAFDNARNEGNFDSKIYYRSLNIRYKINAKKIYVMDSNSYNMSDYGNVSGSQTLNDNKTSIYDDIRHTFRLYQRKLYYKLYELKERFKSIYSDISDSDDAGIFISMVLGDKSMLDGDIREMYQKNGISHLLAISGVKTLKLDIPLVPEPRINWAFVPLHIAIIYILKLCLDEEIIPRCRFPCSRGYLIKCINWQKKQSFSVRLILWQKSKNWQKEKMNMAYKKYREMKVYEASGYQYKRTPSIVLKGKWLSDLGFDIGEQIEVKCEDGRLVITKANEIWMTE